MPHWKHVLKIGDLHEKYKKQEITVQELSKQFADRLEKVPYDDPVLVMAVELLREAEDIEQYDEVLSIVYEFGDIGHRLWVDTTTTKVDSNDEKRQQDAKQEAL